MRSDRRELRARFNGTGSALLAGALLLALASPARAEADCQGSFERWARLSESKLKAIADQKGACIPSETLRKELLDMLARSRAACDAAGSWLDQSPDQTRTLIDANESFITSLGLCPQEVPPQNAAAPISSNAAEAIIAKAKAASPKTATAKTTTAKTTTIPRSCLEVTHPAPQQYTLVNRRCVGHQVLAVVETRDAGGKTACKAYTVAKSLTVAAGSGAPLQVDHECVLNTASCTKDHVGSMFPECIW